MRKSTVFFIYLMANLLMGGFLLIHARQGVATGVPVLARKAGMVKELGLTDLCLFTEASYSRNPSQADLHTPFQDYPLSLEHFPTGSLVAPPPHLTNRRGTHD